TGQEWPGAPQFSPQARPAGPSPSYEEGAAKRLNPPSRNEGLLELIRRYSGPEKLPGKIRSHGFRGPPLRPQRGLGKQGPSRAAAARGLAAQPETEATGSPVTPGQKEHAPQSIASDAEGSSRTTVPSVEETLRRAQGPDGSLELSLSGMRSQIVPEHR